MGTYPFFLEPIGPEANEALAELLNQQGESAASLEHRNVKVAEKLVEVMYEVPRHSIMTIAGHSDHKRQFRAYVQENEGKIRSYSLYKNIGKNISRAKEVRRVKKTLRDKTDQH